MKKQIQLLINILTLLLTYILLIGCTSNINDEYKTKESTNIPESSEENLLSKYSSKEIEYARVWLQLGPNQEIDELNVQHIPAGTPLDPNYENSLDYPEDVVQLTGSRLIDGIVTYSSNGDGTINVYNVPVRWYGGIPPQEDLERDKILTQMKDIIDNTKLVSIKPGEDEKVIELIKKIRRSQ